MKTHQSKIIAYLMIALFAGFLTGSCEHCDEGNNFEDMENAQPLDSLSIQN